MAKAISEEECQHRHEDYPYDIYKNLNSLQRNRIQRMVDLIPNGYVVLDIGCNSGRVVEFKPQCKWHGVDVSPALVEQARKRMVSASVAPAERLQFLPKVFDASVLGEIIEHVFDPVAVLQEAARVTSKLIVGSTPHEAGQWGTATVAKHPHHVRCYTRDTLSKLLEPFGKVHIEIVYDKNKKPQMYVFAVELIDE